MTARRHEMLSETRPAKVGKWTEPALRVLRERYLMREGGEVVETPEEMCWRVALSIAAGETPGGGGGAPRRGGAGPVFHHLNHGGNPPHPPPPPKAGQGHSPPTP